MTNPFNRINNSHKSIYRLNRIKGEFMRYIEKAVKLFKGTQTDFGKKLGVSQSVVSDWCKGKCQVPAKHLVNIVKLVNNQISIEQLLSDRNKKA